MKALRSGFLHQPSKSLRFFPELLFALTFVIPLTLTLSPELIAQVAPPTRLSGEVVDSSSA